MSRIIFVPIERLEQRYTGMMYDVLAPYCDIIVNPPLASLPNSRIKNGQFLDICGTILYKSMQLNYIADLFDRGAIEAGDSFLIGDIFFPGLEAIRYMSDLLGINVKICAFNYAGRADEEDFVQNLGAWSDNAEQCWHDCVDMVFVGSTFHQKKVSAYFKQPKHKVINTGYVWSKQWVEDIHKAGTHKKMPFVIWPHRICWEKGMDLLYRYALTTSRRIIITSCGKKDKAWEQFAGMENVDYRYNLSKKEYYILLDQAEFYLSTARQETFGYTLQEAIYYGCKILAPNAACYPEFLPLTSLYSSETTIDTDFNIIGHCDKPLQFEDNAEIIMDFVRNMA